MSFTRTIFLLIILFSCATIPMRKIELYSLNTGYDVVCSENYDDCYKHAKSQCSDKVRVHHAYEDIDFIMRFECLNSAEADKICSNTGVTCIL